MTATTSMWLLTVLYGAQGVSAVFMKRRMVERIGPAFYMSVSIPDLTKYIWILEIRKLYMPRLISVVATCTPTSAVGQKVQFTRARTVGRIGKSLAADYLVEMWAVLGWILRQRIQISCTRPLKGTVLTHRKIVGRAGARNRAMKLLETTT